MIFIFLTLNISLLNAQDVIYNINVKGKKVGEINAHRSINENKITYIVNSISKVHFFGEITVSTHLIVDFKNGILESSKYTIYKDNKHYDHSFIIRNNNKYIIERNDKRSILKGVIKNCTAQLFFEKPNNLFKIFGELEGVYKDISELDENTFIMTNKRGHHNNIYTFENGILKKGVIDYFLFDFEIIRVK